MSAMDKVNLWAADTRSDVYLADKLQAQDGRLDQLFNLFEKLQVATVETSHPELDLITFSEMAYYFGVIMKKRTAQSTSAKAPVESQAPASPSFIQSSTPKPLSNEVKSPRKRSRSVKWSQVAKVPLDQSQNKIRKLSADAHPSNSRCSQQNTDPSDSVIWPASPTTPPTVKSDSEHDDLNYAHALALYDADDNLPYEFEFEVEKKGEALDEAIGLIYLVQPNVYQDDPLHVRELNIGIILEPEYRGKGYASRAIDMILKKAFQDGQCHRVQAVLPDHVAKNNAICLFTQMRFDNEGTRRRGFFSPLEKVFKDVTYMGLLDTDWALRERDGVIAQRAARAAPKSVWDELFARHQREREELLNWEDGMVMKQSATLVRAQTPTQSDFRKIGDDAEGKDTMEGEDPWEAVIQRENGTGEKGEVSEAISSSNGWESGTFDFPPSSESDADSVRSVSPGGYFSAASSSSSSSSAWDLMESSDSEADSSGLSVASSNDSEDDEWMSNVSQPL
ncbi:hypothetical protein FPV67DRAFT_1161823 [Lyophyllum atratum]|nr:hypothetical protein FPV67DRAFT_1161823 [Lyophyllum atratum]